MYQGTNPELQDLQAQITTLTGRLNNVDGLNLADPAQGGLIQLTRKYEGLKSDLRQSVAKLEQILSDYKRTVSEFLTLLKQHLGM